MALPAFFYTPDRLIKAAMRDAGRLQSGAEPTWEQMSDALDRLADLIIVFQTDGIKLQQNYIHQVTLVAGTAAYTITSPRALRAIEAWYVRTGGSRSPITLISQSEYYNLGNLTHAGVPVQFFPERTQLGVTARLWPVPNAAAVAGGSAYFLIQKEPTAPVELDETLAFAPEAFMALRWGLADELASGQHELIVSRCERKAREFKEKLEAWDVEDASTFFTYNSRG